MFEMHVNIKFPPAFVVTGTDTDVGKTVISALLLNLLQGSYWKPIQCGTQPETDTQFVKNHCFVQNTHLLSEAYLFSRPLAPSQASHLERKEIDINELKIPPHNYKPLIIEGVGGVMTPITDRFLFIDLIKKWKVPAIVVARSTLGTINHTLLTINALKANGIEILGIVFNGPKNTLNKDSIEKVCDVPVIAEMTPVDNLKEICKTLYVEKV